MFSGCFVMYNYKVLNRKREVIPPIPDSMILLDWFQNNKYIFNFTTDDMVSKFEEFTRYNIYIIYNLIN